MRENFTATIVPGNRDAGLFAKIDETWSAQLNVENIFNKSYWATADGNNNISPGQGRTVRVSARARF